MFNRNSFFSSNIYQLLNRNKKYINEEEILHIGKLTEKDYNQDFLKKQLSNIRFEKSFYSVNSKNNVNELDLNGALSKPGTKKLRYYNSNFILGEIPENICDSITDTSIKIEGLKIRDVSPYFSAIYNETVIPCYKENENKCKEKNEFDFEKEDRYAGTKLSKSDEHYITYYQIDKSSESQLVYSTIKFTFDQNHASQYFDKTSILLLEEYHVKCLLFGILDINLMFDFSQNSIRKELYFTFKAFSDNIDKIIKRFIDLFSSEPEEENFNYAKLVAIEDYRKNKDQNFRYYIFSMFLKLKNIKTEDYDKIISELNEITFSEFVDFHKNILALLKTINFDIVGNISPTLVEL